MNLINFKDGFTVPCEDCELEYQKECPRYGGAATCEYYNKICEDVIKGETNDHDKKYY